MTRTRSVLTTTLLALSTSGCFVSSLHPVYDDNSIVFDEALVGTWENRESEITVVVTRGEWKSYGVAFTDRFGTTRFTAHLTTIGPARVLNVRPEDGLEKPAFVLATNGFMQVAVEAGRLRVREPEYGTVLERLRAGKLGIDAATDFKQNVLITASPAKLRGWLAAALKDEAFWADWKTFSRSTR
jgi:hypothetical protein